jgi:hypothetical protein
VISRRIRSDVGKVEIIGYASFVDTGMQNIGVRSTTEAFVERGLDVMSGVP